MPQLIKKCMPQLIKKDDRSLRRSLKEFLYLRSKAQRSTECFVSAESGAVGGRPALCLTAIFKGPTLILTAVLGCHMGPRLPYFSSNCFSHSALRFLSHSD